MRKLINLIPLLALFLGVISNPANADEWSDLRESVVDGATVELNLDVTASDDNPISLYGGYAVINGNGHTINGSDRYQFVYNAGNLTINNVVLSNGRSPEYSDSAAVFNEGTLNVSNSVFSGLKTPASYNVGAGFRNNGYATIVDTNFINNANTGFSNYASGAIYNQGVMSIEAQNSDVIFSGNNSVSSYYGAGAILNYEGATLNLTASGADIAFTGNRGGGGYYCGDALANIYSTTNLRASSTQNIIFNDSLFVYSGTININPSYGETSYSGKIAFNAPAIFDNSSLNFYNGIFAFGHNSQDGNPYIGSMSGLYLTLQGNSTIDMIDGQTGNYIEAQSIGIFNNSIVNVKFDVDAANSTSDYIFANYAYKDWSGESGDLKIAGVNVLNDNPNESSNIFTVQVVRGDLVNRGYVSIVSDLLSEDGVYKVGYDDSTGYVYLIKGEPTDLNAQIIIAGDKIFNTDDTNSDSIAKTISVTNNLGQLGGSSLIINGNGYTIDGLKPDGTNKYTGITVSSGQTLEINNENSLGEVQATKTTVSNFASTSGGAISNSGTIDISNVSFVNNYANGDSSSGGIFNAGNMTIKNSDFVNNISTLYDYSSSGAIYNTATANIYDTSFHSNQGGLAGAIFNQGTMNIIAQNGDMIFENNLSTSYYDSSGAIFNAADSLLTLTANGGNITFTGNRSQNVSGGALNNYYSATTTLRASAGKSIIFNDSIMNSGTININPNDGAISYGGTVAFNAYTSGNFASINLYNGTLALGSNTQGGTTYGGWVEYNNLSLLGNATIDMQDGQTSNAFDATVLTLATDTVTNFKLDVDASTSGSDYIAASTAVQSGSGNNGVIKIASVNIINDDQSKVNSAFAVQSIRGDLTNKEFVTLEEGLQAGDYNVSYDDYSGNLIFVKGIATTLNAQIVGAGERIFNTDENNSDSTAKTIMVTNNLGQLMGTKLTINGNGYTIDGIKEGATGKYLGLTVGSGQTLEINNNDSLGVAQATSTLITNFENSTGGGAINNYGTTNIYNTSFTWNNATSAGAIYNEGTMYIEAKDTDVVFNNNYETSGFYPASAIYNSNSANLTLKATGANMIFSELNPDTPSWRYGEAISNYSSTITLQAKTDKSIVLNGSVYNSAGTININPDDESGPYDGKVTLYSHFDGNSGALVNLYGGILAFNGGVRNNYLVVSSMAGNNLALLGDATIDMIDGNIGNYISAPILTISRDTVTNLRFDVDAANSTSDYIFASSVLQSGSGLDGLLKIAGINVLNDDPEATFKIFSAQVIRGDLINKGYVTIVSGLKSEDGNYKITYDDTTGYIYLVKGDSTLLNDEIIKPLTRIFNIDETNSDSTAKTIIVKDNLGQLEGTKLTINGSGYKIDGLQADGTTKYAGLTVLSGQTLEINNKNSSDIEQADNTIVSNFTNTNGGVINNAGTVNIYKTSFLTNSATSGGAIYNNGGSTTINDSTFSSNSATSGSAIYNNGGSTTINDSTFSSNSATSGGAIYNNSGSITIDGSLFSSNSATRGAAIYNVGTLTLENSSFSGNTSAGSSLSAAVSNVANANMTITDTNFSANVNTYTGTSLGGAIYNQGTMQIIAQNSNILFENNTATATTYHAGAIYNNTSASSTLSLFAAGGNIIFTGNRSSDSANYSAGAFVNYAGTTNLRASSAQNITFNDSTYNNAVININSNDGAVQYGGEIAFNAPLRGYSISGMINIYGGTFALGSNTQGSTLYTGAVSNNRVSLLGNSTIDMIDGATGNNINTSSLTIARNTTTSLKLDVNVSTSVTDFITTTAVSQSGSGNNGVLNISDINILNDDSSKLFKSASVQVARGALFNKGYVTIESGLISQDGLYEIFYDDITGYLYIVKGGSTSLNAEITKRGVKIFNINEENSDSTAKTIDVLDGLGTLVGSSLTINASGYKIDGLKSDLVNKYSGLEVVSGQTLEVNNKNSSGVEQSTKTIFSNFSRTYGGAIYNNGGTTTIYNTSLLSNSALVGGALYNKGTLSIYNSLFSGNNSSNNSSSGGAIYNAVSSSATIVDTNFSANTNGYTSNYASGAIYNLGTIDLIAQNTDVLFENNTATNNNYHAGAIYNAAGSTLNLFANGGNITFTGNIASDSSSYCAGALVNDAATANLRASSGKNITFNDTVYNNSGTININSDNGATKYGGEVAFNAALRGYTTNLAQINLYGGTLSLGSNTQGVTNHVGTIANNKLSVLGNSTIDMVDGQAGNYINTPLLTLGNSTTTNLKFDADASNYASDYLSATSAVQSGGGVNGVINIADVKVLNDDAGQANRAFSIQVIKGDLANKGYVTIVSDLTSEDGNYKIGYDDLTGCVYFIKGNETALNAQIVKTGEKIFNTDANNSNSSAKTIEVTDDMGSLLGTSLVINGNGYTIDGTNGAAKRKGLAIVAGQTLEINNKNSSGVAQSTKTVISNFTNTNGGALYNLGESKIYNTSFLSNSATNAGAIYNKGTLTIENSLFSGNTATASSTGGAIYNGIGYTATITDTSFTGNSHTSASSFAAGAMLNLGNMSIIAKNSDVLFENNSATSASNHAGAIINNNVAAILNMTASGGNITFTGNTASDSLTYSAGSLFNRSGTTNLCASSDKIITFNDTTYNMATININPYDGVTQYSGEIALNAALRGYTTNAGQINLYGGVLSLGSNTQGATNYVGTIANNKLSLLGNSTIDMLDGQTGNYINAPSLTVAKDITTDLKFDVALNVGATAAVSDYIQVTTFTNGATGVADGVFNISDINITRDSDTATSSLTLFKNSSGTSLSSLAYGQIINDYLVARTTNYNYTIAQDATNLGDIIFTRAAKSDDFSVFVKRTDTPRVFNLTTNLELMNDINEMGGVNATATINGNNRSIDGHGYDGVIIGSGNTFVLNNVGSLALSRSMYGFSSTNGGVFNNAGDLQINNSIFRTNAASSNGGVINNEGTLSISGSTFGKQNGSTYSEGNSAFDGGAIYNVGTATITDSNFYANTATTGDGGAIYNTGVLNLVANNSNISFIGNTANGADNAIYMNGGELNLNTAADRSIIFEDAIASIDDSSVINVNSGSSNNLGTVLLNADMSGYNGALNLYGGTLALGANGTFFSNTDFAMTTGSLLELQNNKIDNITLSRYSGSGLVNIDADLSAGTIDNIMASSVGATAQMGINGVKLLTDKTSNQTLKVLSSNISLDDFSISATTSRNMYTIKKDINNDGYVLITYDGAVDDGLIAQINATGTRSFTQTEDTYTATLNLAAINAQDGLTNKLTIFGQNKIFSGDNLFSLFNVDTTLSDRALGVARELSIENATISNANSVEGSALRVNGVGALAVLNNVDFKNNTSSSNGGAIKIGAGASLAIADGANITDNISTSGLGGAIYMQGDATNPATLSIVSNTRDTVFENNSANGVQNSIHMAGNSVLNANNSDTKALLLDAPITTSGDNNILNINKTIDEAPTSGIFALDLDYRGFKGNNNAVNVYNGTLQFTNTGAFFGNTGVEADYINLKMANSSVLDLQNGQIDTIDLNSFETQGDDVTLKLDIDLLNSTVDKIAAQSVVDTPYVNVDTFNIINNSVTDKKFVIADNIDVNYIGSGLYYTTDYEYKVANGDTQGSIDFASSYIAGDGLIRTLKNIGTRSYSMVLDAQDNPEIYTASENLPSMNAEFATGRTNKISIFGNGGTISGDTTYSLLAVDTTSDNVDRTLEMANVTLKDALALKGSALSVVGDRAKVVATSTKFIGNTSVQEGGAVYVDNSAQLNLVGATLKNNTSAKGGAISAQGASVVNIEGATKFENNIASAKGGAIYARGTSGSETVINIKANSGNVEFSENKQNTIDDNAIYMDGYSTLNLNASNTTTSTIVFNDSIASANPSNVININKPNGSVETKGKVVFNADMSDYQGTINLYNGYLNLTKDDAVLNPSLLNVYRNATIDLRNNSIGSATLHNLNLADGRANLSIDIDGLSETADTISASGILGDLIINNFNILSDTQKSSSAPILISLTEGLNIRIAEDAQYLGPVYKYQLMGAGSNSVALSRSALNSIDNLNPMVYTASAGALGGSYANQMVAYEQAFGNVDNLMLMPNQTRQVLRYSNRYASAAGDIVYSPTMIPEISGGLWYRPYSTFETIGLNGGPDVKNTSYGSFVGGEGPLTELGHGFCGTLGGYVGYNGSHQRYRGVDIYQNGGVGGIMGALYKDNFYTALTVNAGGSAVAASSSGGRDNYSMIAAGLSSKTGYNFELFDARLIVQPNMLLSYTFVKTLDYTTSAGASVTSNPLNIFQINPGVKFIGNFRDGWQPYASVSMVWNIMNDANFRANDVSIPKMSIDPYVEYGVGLQKKFGEIFTGYLQSMIRNGGRNGVALQFGMRWAI